MHKDNVEMICSVGELAGLFEKSRDLDSFLQTVVSVIAFHMKAAVCSIYLLDESANELVLRANQGLSPDSVGRVRLKIGEGITGLAVKELRAICEGRGSRNPGFKHIPGIHEERYEAFLAVPILHALQRVGALVVQDPQPDYFNDNDVKALRAIAAQLAVTIENAKLLISLHQRQGPPQAAAPADAAEHRLLKGRCASEGIASGHARIVSSMALGHAVAELPDRPFSPTDFDRALALSEQQLEAMEHWMESRLMDVASLIFNAQLLMLKDRQFSGAMRERIEAGLPVAQAVEQVVNQYVNLFEESRNARLREKIQDVKDLGLRLLRNLAAPDGGDPGYSHSIVVARELLPSDILKYSAQGVQGLVLLGAAGVSAHVAILARSLECPMLILEPESEASIPDHALLIMDAHQGTLLVNPSQEALGTYRPLLDKQPADTDDPNQPADTYTRDGVRVSLLASVNLLSDLTLALRHKAEGVGLYRSEFPFIIRTNFPTEEEQFPIYKKILDQMNGREVVFRTLDIGGDKMLDYFPHADEANPFLGLRAIRFSLRYKEIFAQQLRALLRAGANRDLNIMFPLVASVDDFSDARHVVRECCDQLRNEQAVFNDHPRLGVMIELPSIVELIEELAEQVDFLSIGSNDLIQYLLAVDRTNDQISSLYTAAHPAVLRTINRVARAAEDHRIPLSICGDMATDPALLPFLIGTGIRRFSVDPHALPKLRRHIRLMDAQQASNQAQYLLALPTIRQIQNALADRA